MALASSARSFCTSSIFSSNICSSEGGSAGIRDGALMYPGGKSPECDGVACRCLWVGGLT
eukprot:6200399-Pleurochrysis_carterae.AAC.1